MKLHYFLFYLGVYSINPDELLAYKIEDPKVLDLLARTNALIDSRFNGDEREFFDAAEYEFGTNLWQENILPDFEKWVDKLIALGLG